MVHGWQAQILGLELWQWLGLVLVLLTAYVLGWLLCALLLRVLLPSLLGFDNKRAKELLDGVRRPIRLLLRVGLVYAGFLLLEPSDSARTWMAALCRMLTLAAAAWLILRGIDQLWRLIQRSLERTGRPVPRALLALGRRSLKAIILVGTGLGMLNALGVNVTGMVAGLGIGGIAVALAAQKTLENFFGGINVAVDRPVRVGEFCRFGDRMGTVEDIGLRSTRLRTVERTVVSVPNVAFEAMPIENFGLRDRILMTTTIGLRYETTPEQLRGLLAELRAMLLAHSLVDVGSARVRLVGFGESSLNVEIFAYLFTSDWNTYLEAREEIYLKIMDLVKAAGSDFAFPSRTLYMAREASGEGRSTESV